MEGADDLFAFDDAAVTEVCAEVWAERIEEMRVAILVTEEDKIAPEVSDGLDVSGLEFM
jgi:hypothetical protein